MVGDEEDLALMCSRKKVTMALRVSKIPKGRQYMVVARYRGGPLNSSNTLNFCFRWRKVEVP